MFFGKVTSLKKLMAFQCCKQIQVSITFPPLYVVYRFGSIFLQKSTKKLPEKPPISTTTETRPRLRGSPVLDDGDDLPKPHFGFEALETELPKEWRPEDHGMIGKMGHGETKGENKMLGVFLRKIEVFLVEIKPDIFGFDVLIK